MNKLVELVWKRMVDGPATHPTSNATIQKTFVSAASLLLALSSMQPLCAQHAFLDEAARRGPAVAAVLDLPRETPAQQLLAIFTLLDLGEKDVAAELWGTLAKQKPDAETQAALVAQFGTARFLMLNRQDVDQFAGAGKFVATCLKTSAQKTRDPKRLARLIHQLNDPAAAERNAARVDLSGTSTAGAAACLEALGSATEKPVRANLMLALAEMRPEVDPLLLAVLADGRGQLRRDGTELAGFLQLTEAIPWLAAIVAGAESDPNVVAAAHSALAKMKLSLPTAADARGVIRDRIRRLDAGVLPQWQQAAVVDTWWTFDPVANKLIAQEVEIEARQVLSAARLARLQLQLPLATAEDRQTALIYAYQAAQELNQQLTPEVEQWVTELSTAALNEALEQALQKNAFAAAQAFADLMGKRADQAAIASNRGRPAPLVQSLAHANRSLRFAALQAVIQIAPQRSFAGASGVPKALWYFVAAAGPPQAVAAAATSRRADDWAGQLRGLGYATPPAVTGREAIHTALRSSRLQLLLIDSDISRPLLREVVFQLRSNPHTAHTPIAILSSLENLERAQRLAQNDDRLLAMPRPHGPDAMQALVDQLAKLADHNSAEERLAQAEHALGWIAELLEQGHPYDEFVRDAELLRQAIYVPELTGQILRVLPRLGTATSQQLLVDMASTPTQPISLRRQAADALAVSVQQAGKLLTSQEILRQYDRYNASETADADTQAVLGQVLDIFEAK